MKGYNVLYDSVWGGVTSLPPGYLSLLEETLESQAAECRVSSAECEISRFQITWWNLMASVN